MHWPCRELVHPDGIFDKSYLGRTIDDGRDHLLRISDPHAYRDLGMSRLKMGKALREPITRRGLACVDVNCTALQPAQLAECLIGRGRRSQDRARFFKKDAAVLRQLDPAPDPVKQHHAVLGFQRVYGPADGRLGQVKRFCGACHVFALSDANDNPKLIEGHINDRKSRSIWRDLLVGPLRRNDRIPVPE
jgi:hypothetical protein